MFADKQRTIDSIHNHKKAVTIFHKENLFNLCQQHGQTDHKINGSAGEIQFDEKFLFLIKICCQLLVAE